MSNDIEFHELDPNGDVLLVVWQPNDPFVIWDTGEESQGDEATDTRAAQMASQFSGKINPANLEEQPSLSTADGPEVVKIKIKASSSHLILASPYFAAMLSSKWKESTVHGIDKLWQVDVCGWDPKSFLLVMVILHCRTSKAPRSLNLEDLAKVAIIVDYYACHEAVRFAIDTWFDTLVPQVADSMKKSPRALVLWILICAVLKKAEQLSFALEVAVKYSTAPLRNMGLPIPGRLVEDINRTRNAGIAFIVNFFQGNYDSLTKQRKPMCSLDCDSERISCLAQHMKYANLGLPRREAPFTGLCLNDLSLAVRDFRFPPCPKILGNSCELKDQIESMLSIAANLTESDLEDIQERARSQLAKR